MELYIKELSVKCLLYAWPCVDIGISTQYYDLVDSTPVTYLFNKIMQQMLLQHKISGGY
jgi:hypothetical protein